MASTLHLDGLPEEAVTLGLVALREKCETARKANEKIKRSTHEIDELDDCAADLLKQLGYVEPAKEKKHNVGEVVRDDRQKELPLNMKPLPRARVTCANEDCRRRFAVPIGDCRRKCPDCGTIQHVVSDEDGNVYRQEWLIEPPDEMRALHVREQSEDLAPLKPLEKKQLAKWQKDNPLHIWDGELVEPGERVADPSNPGSGNPLEIICDSYVGNQCPGFTTTDTAGESVCPKCGSKWTVSIEGRTATEKGKVLVTAYQKPADPPAAAEG